MINKSWVGSAALILASMGFAATGCDGRGPTVSRVVIVSFDTTRADRLGCYGHEDAETPHVDALAAEGVLFEHAVSPVPTTLPSHSTMFTGVYPQDHGVRYNLVFRLGPQAVTLAERLRDEGFATAGFPSAFVLGSQYGLNQGFDTYPEPPGGIRSNETPLAHNGDLAGTIVDRALTWLGDQAGVDRQFLWLHFYDPHAPYLPPFPYSSTHRERPYDGELAYADAQFGRLMERLRADPAWDRTLVIVVGDHGEGLHEHGERFHANLVYESTQRVPLIIRAPGARAGRVAEPVSLVDITPTVLDFVGIDSSAEFRGISLRGGVEGHSPAKRDIYFESLAGSMNYGWAELRGVRYGDWKLIDSDPPELFNLADDPGELNNLAELEAQRVEDLRASLADLQQPLSGEMAAQPSYEAMPDPETEAFLASLGYVGGSAGGSAAGAVAPRDQIDLEPELLAGQTSVAERDWAAVENICRYVLGRDERNKWALNNLSGALMWTERYTEARDYALEMIHFYPDVEQGYIMAARAYRGAGDTGKSREILARGLEKLPDSQGLSYLYLVAGFDLEIESVCTDEVPEAIERHTQSALLRVLRSRCEAMNGMPEKALATLKEAVELGFTDVQRLNEAEEFSEVVQMEEFRALAATADPGEAGAGGD
jgi:arylsulfatase A-like enzyme